MHFRTKRYFIFGLSLLAFTTHCLSFPGHGFFRSFRVVTSPERANVQIFRDGKLIDEKTTPTRIYVTRSSDLEMRISSPGHRAKMIKIRFIQSEARNSVSLFSGALCIFVPYLIDYNTGVLKIPERDRYEVHLQPEAATDHQENRTDKHDEAQERSFKIEFDPKDNSFIVQTLNDTP